MPSRRISAAVPIPASATQKESRKLQANVRLSRRQNQAAVRPTTNGIRKKLGQMSGSEALSSSLAQNQTARRRSPPTALPMTIPRIRCPIGRSGGRGGDDSMKRYPTGPGHCRINHHLNFAGGTQAHVRVEFSTAPDVEWS